MAKAHKFGNKHGSSTPDGWVFGGLLALVVWAPLPLGSNRYWAIGVLLAIACVLLVGSLWANRRDIAGLLDRLHAFRWPIGLLAVMTLLSWIQVLPLPENVLAAVSPLAAEYQQGAASKTVSLDQYQSQVMASLAFVYFAVFIVAALVVRNVERLDRLATTLVWSGVLQAVLSAILFSMKAEYRLFFVSVSHERMIGSFVYHNSLAGYLCMCLSVGIGLMLSRLGDSQPRVSHWKARIVSAIQFMLSPKMRLRLLLVVMVIALVLTRSRMGNAALFVAMLSVGLVATVLARRTAPQTLTLIASLIIIDVFVVGTWVGLEKVVERIQETELTVADGGRSESVEARTEAARTALPIVRDFPIAGTGGGTFYNVFLSYRTPSYGYTYVDHTHNDFVEIATDYGLVGLGTLGLLVLLTLGKAITVISQRKSRLPWGVAFGVAMGIVGLLVHSTVDFNLQIPANGLTIVVILAMGWIASVVPSAKSSRSSSKRATK